jgi:hypothetical protein
MHSSVRISMLAGAALVAFGGIAQAQQQAPQAPNMTFFVTSQGLDKGGNLGGLEGADAQCQKLATGAGAGSKTWHAYLSSNTNMADPSKTVNARDRIGKGPWQNFKGVVIATSVDDLHGDGNKLGPDVTLTERGSKLPGFGFTPNYHDILTGSQMDGKAWPGNMNLTCNNWTSDNFGKAMLGHMDRRGGADTVFQHSWVAAHQSRDCTPDGLRSTGGNGLFYCFAQ